MSLGLWTEESTVNLTNKIWLIDNIKKNLEVCEIDQKEQHWLISVQRGYCYYDLTRFFKKFIMSFHNKFTIMGKCETDDGGVWRGFYSGNIDGSWQLITEAFHGAKFDLLSIRSKQWVCNTVSIIYFKNLVFNNFLKIF